MRVRTPWPTALAAGLLAAAVLGAAGTTARAAGDEGTRTVEYFPDSRGAGRHTEAPTSPPGRISREQQAPAVAPDATPVTPLQRTGPSDGRLDLVVIGDGYTADQQGDFHQDAQAKLDAIFAIEPYKSYQGLFNFWLVDAASNQSGVSGDPTKDVVRDTAVSSYFFCSDTERLLCVDEKKVDTYAQQAPGSDIVFVISNSSKYGGAGYSGLTSTAGHTGIATMSSDNDRSYLIGAHELGHSIGLLADEYQYDGYGTYPDSEPAEPNTTKQTADGMRSMQTKWYRWLGQNDPAGGTVGAYEGAGYYEYGIYRPTQNSIMRALDTDAFNLPGREAMIAGFYRNADLVTAAGTLRVDLAPLPKGLADVQVRWYVDGAEVVGAAGERALKAASLNLRKGTHTVTAKAVDRTTALRDPAARQAASNSVTWTVSG
ncbi:M64 family metallopeptidase [Streptomyces kunmingensis]|uniref:M64 family metallopeptidase n=1 Tax=Streptomyces kunmingensis TaxID=68225 RepID=A0ABU6CHL1_9ACTN|nr:M64 family metallopeptidase [Streptomyces kunmingensis]MEB3963602.1 M64 family metallopeptidase [Streptomyces kunmingensis]